MEVSDLQNFAETLKAKFALPGAASPEDQLKPPVADLVKAAGSTYGLSIETRTETHLAQHAVRPDMAIYVGGLICGYIELKAPGSGADAPKLKGEHNKKQWEKLKGLPNLIYTDGREWALYRLGDRPDGQPIVRLHDDPTEKGKAAIKPDDAGAVGRLLRDFLQWSPTVPHEPTALARYLAPLTRFLRSEVETALYTKDSAIQLLANEWRQYFFPDADDARFADAYAQTVTYAMLLARLSGAEKLDPTHAAQTLDKNNGLLARTLELLGQTEARNELRVGFELLQRSLEALDAHSFLKGKPDLWLYFYEDFLAAYDPKLRKDYGVYYTPREVVELQVRLASELLEKRFGKKLGFADDGVVFLDPAVGTGTYPVAAVKHGLEKVRARSGEGAVAARAEAMAENMYGFEVLVGPYAVAHLRLTQALEGSGATIKDRLKIYLADTLESPNVAPPGGLTLTYRALTQEHEAARRVKTGGDILVCLGNPPYDRQQIEADDTTTHRKGGWVRFGDQITGAAKQEQQAEHAIFKDFIEPATKAGAGVHVKNLYNDYIYFWRWALWRLFERQDCGGIVTFITASSYLGGPGFIGVRERMRREFDHIYIINLGGDLIGTRKTPNVFNIQTPVAIALGYRGRKKNHSTPAIVRYIRIEAESRSDKLKAIESIESIDEIEWEEVQDEWNAPFYPRSRAAYFFWPELSAIFPWQHSGAQLKRVWPIGETEDLLSRRWAGLLSSQGDSRKKAFKESRDRRIDKSYENFSGDYLPRIDSIIIDKNLPEISRYCYRSFDRQYVIFDNRIGDYMRPPLISVCSEHNVFFSSLISKMLGVGAAIAVSAHLPDLDVFCGRGGKDVIPLYRDAAGTLPNVTAALLPMLGDEYGTPPSPESLAAYVYALLAGQSYTHRFWNELETPGPRVPLTKDPEIFADAAALGRQLIWLHTYAERFRGEGHRDEVPQGAARIVKGIAADPARYPEAYSYDVATREIVVGDGRFGPVAPEVWAFEVSGLKVVQSWLGYRMKKRAGKKSSPLDDIRPERWTPRMSDELLEMVWVLEATLAMEPQLAAVLDRAVAGPCFLATELPRPSEAERKPPTTTSSAGGLLQMMGVEDDDEVD